MPKNPALDGLTEVPQENTRKTASNRKGTAAKAAGADGGATSQESVLTKPGTTVKLKSGSTLKNN